MKVLVLILLIIIYLLPSDAADLKVSLVSALSIVWTCYVAIFILYHQNNKNKKNKRKKRLFVKDIPSIMTPLELGYLLKGKIDSSMLGVSVMELIRKKALLLRYNPKRKDYVFIYNRNSIEEITNSERALLDWLLKKIGDGGKVPLSLIKKDARTNSSYFLSCYNNWHMLASFEGTKTNFFETKKNVVESSLAFVGLSLVMALLGLAMHVSLYLVTLCLLASVILIIYVSFFYLRTNDGNEEYSKWISLSHSIKRGEACNNITDLTTISRFIVYAKLLHKRIDKSLNIILENNGHVYDNDEFIMYARGGIFNEICSKMNKLVPTALTLSFVFVKNNGSRATVRYKKDEEV
jgi:hypothetical protein